MAKAVSIEGVGNFVKLVGNYSKNVQNGVQEEIVRSSLRIERAAKIAAPWETGWLSSQIYSVSITLYHSEIVSPVEYSIYQEYGTRYMMAQPFMFPSLKADYYVFMNNINRIVKRG